MVVVCEVTSIVAATIPQINYDMGTGVALSVPLPALTVTPTQCAPFVQLAWQKNTAAAYLTIDSVAKQIKVQSTNTADVGTKTVDISASMPPNPKIKLAAGVTFPIVKTVSVVINCLVSGLVPISAPSDISYVISAPQKSVMAPVYNVVPQICSAGVTVTLTMATITNPLPTNAGITYANNALTVQSTDNTLLGTAVDAKWDASIPLSVSMVAGATHTVTHPFKIFYTGQTCSVTSIVVQPSPIVIFDMGQGVPIKHPLPPYKVSPPECQGLVILNWQLNQVYPFAQLDTATNSINVMTQDTAHVGIRPIGLNAKVQFSPDLILAPGMPTNFQTVIDINIKCAVSSISGSASVVNYSYIMTSPVLSIPPPKYTIMPAICAPITKLNIQPVPVTIMPPGFIFTGTTLDVGTIDKTLAGSTIALQWIASTAAAVPTLTGAAVTT